MAEDWVELQLGDVCTLRAGSAFKRELQGQKLGDYPFIKVSDMNLASNIYTIRAANNWVSKEVADQLKAKIFGTGTTVFAKIGEGLKANRVRILERPTLIDNNMMGATPLEGIDPHFLRFLLSTFDFGRYASGTAVPYISQMVLSQVPVSVPQLSVQKRISGLLISFDELIANNTRRIDILEEMACAIYREWFVEFRYPGHEDVPLVESELGPIPKGWGVTDLATEVMVDRSNIKPAESPDEEFAHYSIPAFDSGHLPSVETGSEILSGKYELTMPSVMMSKLNPRFPRVWRVDPTAGSLRSVASTEFMVFVDPSNWSLEYLYGVFVGSDIKDTLVATASGTSTSHQRVKPSDVVVIPLIGPRLDLVKQYTEIVRAMLELAGSLLVANQALSARRDLLLPKLVSGEIDVSEIDLDNVA